MATGGSEAKSEQCKEITILLLGETGVGKSTFINAFANYVLYDKMTDAANNLQCLIPTSFGLYDDSISELREVAFGEPDSNECNDKTESCTQLCRCYDFHTDDISLKIIDTPGIGDNRGVKKDAINVRNILNFLSNYKKLNAICILVKPNNARVGIIFKYCILELLTNLNKSASSNILFIFTNTRGTFYKPGDTAKPLRKVLEDIKSKPPYVEIKFSQENYFCFDSEAFRYLVAVSEPNNVHFDINHKHDFEKSWERSASECQRLFRYIKSLTPHLVQDTISINNIRTKIINMRKSIALIVENIGKEILGCEAHEKKIQEFDGDIKELEKELYTPALDIVSEQLDNPITVCSDPSCCEKKSIGNITKTHYKSVCHKPCYLETSDGNIVGNVGLLDCQAFNKYKNYGKGHMCDVKNLIADEKVKSTKNGKFWGFCTRRTKSETCFECNHSYLVHLTINYDTKIVSKQIRDENKYDRITLNQQAIQLKQYQIDLIKVKVKELNEEKCFITESFAYFARFLLNNALTPFNDALEEYIMCAICNEEKGNGDMTVIKGLQDLLNAYVREKAIFEKLSSEDTSGKSELTTTQIDQKIEKLFQLKHYGKTIKTHMDLEEQGQLLAHVVSKEKKIRIHKSGNNFHIFDKC